jgi:hypothetical protein
MPRSRFALSLFLSLSLSLLLLSGTALATGTQQQKLTASDAAALDEYSRAVSVHGDVLVVGADEDGDLGARSGGAYVYTRTGTVWTEVQKLLASDGAAGDNFGVTLRLEGNDLVLGAVSHDLPAVDAGAAYVFTYNGSTWSQQQKLSATDAASGDQLGRSVFISGGTVVAGAHHDDDGGSNSGSVYVFVRSGMTWSQQQKLIASDAQANAEFGRRVVIDGDTLAVGAPLHDDTAGANQGAVYVFTRTGTVWTQQQKLLASVPAVNDGFGFGLALRGDTLAVGCPGADDTAGAQQGAVYVFTRSGTTWTEQAKLTTSDAAAGDMLGTFASLDGSLLAVGANEDDEVGGANSGSTYVFQGGGASWTQICKLVPSDGAAGDQFGEFCSISGTTVVGGARYHDAGGADSGAAYVFVVQDITAPVIDCPAAVASECTSPQGAVVTFSVTAIDDIDPDPQVVCTPPSGSLFPIGVTQVSCTATDDAGNMDQCLFDVTVGDTVAPSVNCPANMTVECTGPSGAVVSFSVTATDDCDSSVTVVSTPPSGSVFPLGTTQVDSTATDDSGNMSFCSFMVTVEDTTAPSLSCPMGVAAECESPSGTVVDFASLVSATDLCDTSVAIVSVPASGSAFTLGTTQVTCTATDDAGNMDQCMFDVVISDTTAPDIQCPADIFVPCDGPSGRVVDFTVTATDLCDASVQVTSVPPSGSVFPVGTTQVDSEAMDATGNVSPCSFNVTVLASVLPADGTEDGNNHINIFGCGFNDPNNTMVFFGLNEAAVTFVALDHIGVRTPPGVPGVVDVMIMDSAGTIVLPQAYTYVERVVASRFGNVNVGAGDRENVLLINGGAGDAERIVDVAVDSPFMLEALVPSSRTTSRYAMWATPGLSDETTIVDFGFDIGWIAMQPPFAGGNPRKTWNLLLHKQILGCSDFPSQPAPTVFFNRPGRSRPVTVTFFGIIRDDAPRVGEFSVMNSIALRIQ